MTKPDSVYHEQFVFIHIAIALDSSSTTPMIEPLIRKSCDYEFEEELSFKWTVSSNGDEMIYTVILPSCDTQSISLCTYFIVMETSDETMDDEMSHRPSAGHYELSASLGILLEFQRKYSYSTDRESDDGDGDNDDSHNGDHSEPLNKEEDDHTVNVTCRSEQFYGLRASITDFPIGIIIQPELFEADSSLMVTQFTSDPNPEINRNRIIGFKGDAVSESYGVPENGYSAPTDYVLFTVELNRGGSGDDANNENNDFILSKMKYIIYSQSNISYLQVSVINSGGWFLLLILVFLIVVAMCRKHLCLRESSQRLSYNDILESIQLQNPLLFNLHSENAASSDDQKSVGLTSDELDKVSMVEIYRKKSFQLKRRKSHHERDRYHHRKYKNCCICLFDYRDGEPIRILKCNHYFHKKCVDIWFRKRTQCPLCKQSVLNAQILSRRSQTASTASTTSSTASNSDPEKKEESTESDSDSDHGKCEMLSEPPVTVIEMATMHGMQQSDHRKHTQTHSLSDSHCIQMLPRNRRMKASSSGPLDDLHLPNHGGTIRKRKSQSDSMTASGSSDYLSSGSKRNTPTMTSNIPHSSTTMKSMSISTLSQQQHSNELSETMRGIMPLSPQINFYFDSVSNEKTE